MPWGFSDPYLNSKIEFMQKLHALENRSAEQKAQEGTEEEKKMRAQYDAEMQSEGSMTGGKPNPDWARQKEAVLSGKSHIEEMKALARKVIQQRKVHGEED